LRNLGEHSILIDVGARKVSFPVVVSGPSGAGKTSLCQGVVADDPDVVYSISATTRPRRTEEADGRDYHFVDTGRFKSMVEAGEFLEWATVHDHLYGTPVFSVRPFLARGKVVIMDLDVQGGLSMKEVFPDGVFVFVVPPSFGVLERRLRERNTDAEEVVRTRLRNAREEIRYRKHYDYFIINDELHKALADLKSIIEAEKCRVSRLFAGVGD
jgi:guanylate kinase